MKRMRLLLLSALTAVAFGADTCADFWADDDGCDDANLEERTGWDDFDGDDAEVCCTTVGHNGYNTKGDDADLVDCPTGMDCSDLDDLVCDTDYTHDGAGVPTWTWPITPCLTGDLIDNDGEDDDNTPEATAADTVLETSVYDYTAGFYTNTCLRDEDAVCVYRTAGSIDACEIDDEGVVTDAVVVETSWDNVGTADSVEVAAKLWLFGSDDDELENNNSDAIVCTECIKGYLLTGDKCAPCPGANGETYAGVDEFEHDGDGEDESGCSAKSCDGGYELNEDNTHQECDSCAGGLTNEAEVVEWKNPGEDCLVKSCDRADGFYVLTDDSDCEECTDFNAGWEGIDEQDESGDCNPTSCDGDNGWFMNDDDTDCLQCSNWGAAGWGGGCTADGEDSSVEDSDCSGNGNSVTCATDADGCEWTSAGYAVNDDNTDCDPECDADTGYYPDGANDCELCTSYDAATWVEWVDGDNGEDDADCVVSECVDGYYVNAAADDCDACANQAADSYGNTWTTRVKSWEVNEDDDGCIVKTCNDGFTIDDDADDAGADCEANCADGTFDDGTGENPVEQAACTGESWNDWDNCATNYSETLDTITIEEHGTAEDFTGVCVADSCDDWGEYVWDKACESCGNNRKGSSGNNADFNGGGNESDEDDADAADECTLPSVSNILGAKIELCPVRCFGDGSCNKDNKCECEATTDCAWGANLPGDNATIYCDGEYGFSTAYTKTTDGCDNDSYIQHIVGLNNAQSLVVGSCGGEFEFYLQFKTKECFADDSDDDCPGTDDDKCRDWVNSDTSETDHCGNRESSSNEAGDSFGYWSADDVATCKTEAASIVGNHAAAAEAYASSSWESYADATLCPEDNTFNGACGDDEIVAQECAHPWQTTFPDSIEDDDTWSGDAWVGTGTDEEQADEIEACRDACEKYYGDLLSGLEDDCDAQETLRAALPTDWNWGTIAASVTSWGITYKQLFTLANYKADGNDDYHFGQDSAVSTMHPLVAANLFMSASSSKIEALVGQDGVDFFTSAMAESAQEWKEEEEEAQGGGGGGGSDSDDDDSAVKKSDPDAANSPASALYTVFAVAVAAFFTL